MVNRIFSVAVLLVGGVFLYESRLYAVKTPTQTFSSAFYPRIVLSIMIILSLILLVKSFFRKTADHSDQEKKSYMDTFRQHWRVPVIFFLFILYVFLMSFLGFIISTILFLVSSLFVLTIPFSWKKGLIYIPFAVTFTLLVNFVFEYELNILLP